MAKWTSLSLDNPLSLTWAAWACFPTLIFVSLVEIFQVRFLQVLTSCVFDKLLGTQPLIAKSRYGRSFPLHDGGHSRQAL